MFCTCAFFMCILQPKIANVQISCNHSHHATHHHILLVFMGEKSSVELSLYRPIFKTEYILIILILIGGFRNLKSILYTGFILLTTVTYYSISILIWKMYWFKMRCIGVIIVSTTIVNKGMFTEKNMHVLMLFLRYSLDLKFKIWLCWKCPTTTVLLILLLFTRKE